MEEETDESRAARGDGGGLVDPGAAGAAAGGGTAVGGLPRRALPGLAGRPGRRGLGRAAVDRPGRRGDAGRDRPADLRAPGVLPLAPRLGPGRAHRDARAPRDRHARDGPDRPAGAVRRRLRAERGPRHRDRRGALAPRHHGLPARGRPLERRARRVLSRPAPRSLTGCRRAGVRWSHVRTDVRSWLGGGDLDPRPRRVAGPVPSRAGAGRVTAGVAGPGSRKRCSMNPHALPATTHSYLARAAESLSEAVTATEVPTRYACAHVAALRAAAALLAARAKPVAPTRRRPQKNAWVLLTEVAPELSEWAGFFAAGAGKRAAAEAGSSRAVSEREADDLVRDADRFL